MISPRLQDSLLHFPRPAGDASPSASNRVLRIPRTSIRHVCVLAARYAPAWPACGTAAAHGVAAIWRSCQWLFGATETATSNGTLSPVGVSTVAVLLVAAAAAKFVSAAAIPAASVALLSIPTSTQTLPLLLLLVLLERAPPLHFRRLRMPRLR